MSPLAVAADAFRLIAGHAGRRETLTYGAFAEALALGSPRNLGWLLTPLLRWCQARGLPWLPILVVRASDGLPSGEYAPREIAAETARVFDHDWSGTAPPSAGDLHPFALPRLPAALAAPIRA